MCHSSFKEPLFSYVTRSFCRVPYQWLSLAPSSTRRTNLCRFIVRFLVNRSFQPLLQHCIRLSRPQCLKKVSPLTFPSVYSCQINLRVRSNSTQIIFTQKTFRFRRYCFSQYLSLLMSAFSLLIPPFLFPKKFQRSTECSATTQFIIEYITSVFCLSSLSSSAQTNSIQVSWYAFFQGWLLPSLPSCCFRLFTSFPLSKIFGTLFYVLGCFPLVHEASPSWTVYTLLKFLVF